MQDMQQVNKYGKHFCTSPLGFANGAKFVDLITHFEAESVAEAIVLAQPNDGSKEGHALANFNWKAAQCHNAFFIRVLCNILLNRLENETPNMLQLAEENKKHLNTLKRIPPFLLDRAVDYLSSVIQSRSLQMC